MAEDQYIDIVFQQNDHGDGVPQYEFIEVENEQKQSFKTGEWVEDGDGYHRLRIKVKPGLNALAAKINATAAAHGFWDEERNFGEMIALMHSELSEALEEHREGRPAHYYRFTSSPSAFIGGTVEERKWLEEATDEELRARGVSRKPEGVAVELADALIRILDTMQSLDVDIEEIVREKMRYNDGRMHKHGKAY